MTVRKHIKIHSDEKANTERVNYLLFIASECTNVALNPRQSCHNVLNAQVSGTLFFSFDSLRKSKWTKSVVQIYIDNGCALNMMPSFQSCKKRPGTLTLNTLFNTIALPLYIEADPSKR